MAVAYTCPRIILESKIIRRTKPFPHALLISFKCTIQLSSTQGYFITFYSKIVIWPLTLNIRFQIIFDKTNPFQQTLTNLSPIWNLLNTTFEMWKGNYPRVEDTNGHRLSTQIITLVDCNVSYLLKQTHN